MLSEVCREPNWSDKGFRFCESPDYHVGPVGTAIVHAQHFGDSHRTTPERLNLASEGLDLGYQGVECQFSPVDRHHDRDGVYSLFDRPRHRAHHSRAHSSDSGPSKPSLRRGLTTRPATRSEPGTLTADQARTVASPSFRRRWPH